MGNIWREVLATWPHCKYISVCPSHSVNTCEYKILTTSPSFFLSNSEHCGREPWTPEKFQECWLCSDQSQYISGHARKPHWKPQTNWWCCCLLFSFLTTYWLSPCNTITIHLNISCVHGFVSFTVSFRAVNQMLSSVTYQTFLFMVSFWALQGLLL